MSLVSLLLVVLAAFIHATWNLLSKRAADAGPTFVLAYNMFACLIYLPWMIWLLVYGELKWNLPVAVCLALSACIHLAYSLCLQRGYQLADITLLQPIGFLSLIWNTLLGYFLFFQSPDVWTFVGAAVIFASAMYISHREAVRRAQIKTADTKAGPEA